MRRCSNSYELASAWQMTAKRLAVALGSAALLGAAPAAAEQAPRPKPVTASVVPLETKPADVSAQDTQAAPESADSVAAVEPTAPAPADQAAEPSQETASKPAVQRTSIRPKAKPKGLSPLDRLTADQYRAAASAARAALAGEYRRAFALAEKLNDPSTRTLVEWLYARSSSLGAGLGGITAFLDTHPDWPDRRALRIRAEAVLYSRPHDADQTLSYFAHHPPLTGAGKIAQATAYLQSDNKAKAREIFTKVWREERLSSGLERTVRARCDRCITKELDRERLDRMAHRGDHDAAERAAKRLGRSYAKLALARKSVAVRSRRANSRYKAVPASLRSNPGMVLSRITWLRRNDLDDDALKLLKSAPTDVAGMLEPEAWWTERRLVGRRILGLDKAADAYKVTSQHGLTEGSSFSDAEFLAGWIALRHLDRPDDAVGHFAKLRKAVATPISIARAEYWLGRAHKAKGDEETARQHYAEAAKRGTTYYGQLARQIVRGDEAILDLPGMPIDPGGEIAALETDHVMQAGRLLASIGQRRLAGRFFRHLANTTTSAVRIDHLAKTANAFAMMTVSVRIGKLGLIKGVPVHEVAFPTIDYPTLDPAPDVEPALLLALTRQESEFNWQAQSHAGARGLMQVMPATGKMVARETGVPWSLKRLSEDPVYNANLGAAYIRDRIAEFGGSYVLAIAAYNAGPGRVRQWIDRFGDPRDPSVDTIDWVETIPFDETRNYVQRVLENLQVYRARLGDSTTKLQLASDLERGSSGFRRAAVETN